MLFDIYADKRVILGISGNSHFRPRIIRFWQQGVTLTLNRTFPFRYLPARGKSYLGSGLRTTIMVLNPSKVRGSVSVRVIRSTHAHAYQMTIPRNSLWMKIVTLQFEVGL